MEKINYSSAKPDCKLTLTINGKECETMLYDGIRLSNVPDGKYAYELRGSDEDCGVPATVEHKVCVNFCGTIVADEPIDFCGNDFAEIEDLDYDFGF